MDYTKPPENNKPVVTTPQRPRAMPSIHVRSIAVDLILTVLTCGIFNLVVQYKQIKAVNDMLKQEKYSFIMWLILTIVTFGLYHIYHEYRMMMDILSVSGSTDSTDALICLVLSVFGLSVVADAIQQARINSYYGSNAL